MKNEKRFTEKKIYFFYFFPLISAFLFNKCFLFVKQII